MSDEEIANLALQLVKRLERYNALLMLEQGGMKPAMIAKLRTYMDTIHSVYGQDLMLDGEGHDGEL